MCATCGLHGNDNNMRRTCYGHVGYIAVSTPIYNTFFFDFLLKVLKVFCYNCSHFVIGK